MADSAATIIMIIAFGTRQMHRLANARIAKYAALKTITEDFYDSIVNINVRGVLFTDRRRFP
jgi:hypothetical protein